ncbi:tyrosine-protein phosphatase Lar isoform X2 [Nematostella vectensis]|uniref:tyrosine-protein phosphatase Lar isoform X2 n=1 Tax=Nematostella vectensis TaxID=45351 RepID=UPI002076F40C|nr:tyrosine-protein phosphatase Lar isoform X2 [Nematostella vectensis]
MLASQRTCGLPWLLVWTLSQVVIWHGFPPALGREDDGNPYVWADGKIDTVQANVGQTVSLVWRYDMKGQDYDSLLWGKADEKNNFQSIFFIKTPAEAMPVLQKSVPPSFLGRIRIKDRATLEITNVQLSDEGNYVCELRTLFMMIKAKINLIVIAPAKIKSSPPATVQYKEGEVKKLVCKATGKPNPWVIWYKDGKEVMKRKKRAEIAFDPVTDADMASYKCVAQNSGGKEERVTNVTVMFKPKETTLRTDANGNTVSVGSTVSFFCAARGYPKPTYKFYIKARGQPPRRLDYRDAELTGHIKNLGVVDSRWHGTYICIPSNSVGEGPRQELLLYVRYPPQIIRPPRDMNVDEGDQKTIVQCQADGYPSPQITWLKLSRPDQILSKGETFFITSVTREDHGLYRCMARNNVGAAAIKDFTINVRYPPVINTTASSRQVAAWIGYRATLDCYADGNPLPKYTWRNASGVIAVSETGGKLTVTAHDNSAFGDYTCEASNSRGRDSHTVTLIKVGKPGPITLNVNVRTQNSLHVQWAVSDTGQSKIMHFTLKYKLTGPKTSWVTLPILQAKISKYVVKELEPFTSYTLRLTATNEYFTSEPVDVTTMTTEAASSEPRDIVVFPVNNSAVTVKWQEPAKINAKSLSGYTVLYCRIPECDGLASEATPRVSVAHNITTAVIGSLQAFSNYTVRVKAFNTVGGAESKSVLVTTAMAAPSVPELLKVNTSGFEVRLRWNRPRMLNGEITMFRVRFQWKLLNDGSYSEEELLIPADVTDRRRRQRRRVKHTRLHFNVLRLRPQREMLISGLYPYAQYTISVCEGTGGINRGVMWGPYSDRVSVEMPEGPPSRPVNLGAYSTDLDSLSISWERPDYPNGKIRQYTIMYSNTTGRNYSVNIREDLKSEGFKYHLKGLRPYSPYTIRVRAYTLYAGPFSDPVHASTGLQSPNTAARESEMDSGSLFGGVFAGIILFAFVIIIAVLLVRNRRRKRDSTELKGNRYGVANSNDSGIGEKESLDNVPGVKYMQGRRGSEEVIGPGKFVTVKPIPVNKLAEYCQIHHSTGNKSFKEEFMCIRTPGNFSWDHSLKEENKPKNRYQNIVAYDHTRVAISELDGIPGSDYINANFIDGYNHRNKFIATQGPVSNTFDDFWRMVWEHGCSGIVMVTNIVERGKLKCQKYWPSANPEEYGRLVVTPLEEEELSHYVIRKFCIEIANSDVESPAREIVQYHYTAWPDHGVPTHATSLLSFIRRIRNSVSRDAGPIVVHCSAGVGRTGTYIVLDAMLDQMSKEGAVDIFGFVSHTRLQRNMMVQTEAQYIFIHDALMEAAKCGNTEFKVQDLHDRIKALQSRDPDSGDTYIAKEFKNLDIGDSDVETFDSASMPENKSKNRFLVLPYDRTRVKLWPYPGVLGSDYINASFIDSYQQREAFLATQAPLETTINDFWRMLWEYESYTVVMLNKDSENIKGQSYLPDKGEFVVYGLLMVEVESEERQEGYIKRQLKISNTKSSEVRNVFHFQYEDWPEDGVPQDGKLVIDMLKHIARAQQQTGNGPITVHCSDGSGRTGTFCAISIALERVKLDATIDMFQTVRNLRTQRPIMVQTPEQYKFCYEVVRHFVEAFSDYANFK